MSVAGLFCVLVAGCADPSPPGGEVPGVDAPATGTDAGTSDTGGGDGGGDGGGGSENGGGGGGGGEAPGVPGSPIPYDNTLFNAGPDLAKQSIERQIAEQCGPDLCGVRVDIEQRGDGDCITEISPRPVQPGGTVTIYAGGSECDNGELEPEPELPSEEPPTGSN
jgi:hypothetical protein